MTTYDAWAESIRQLEGPARVRESHELARLIDKGEFTMAREGPYGEDGYYTCPCGTDRHGKPYNRKSIIHMHAAPCLRCGEGKAADGDDWCARCEDEDAAEALAALRDGLRSSL
jgi:hypothetical protein